MSSPNGWQRTTETPCGSTADGLVDVPRVLFRNGVVGEGHMERPGIILGLEKI